MCPKQEVVDGVSFLAYASLVKYTVRCDPSNQTYECELQSYIFIDLHFEGVPRTYRLVMRTEPERFEETRKRMFAEVPALFKDIDGTTLANEVQDLLLQGQARISM